MVLLEEVTRLGDNGKVLLGEFLAEVSELVPQNGSRGPQCLQHLLETSLFFWASPEIFALGAQPWSQLQFQGLS